MAAKTTETNEGRQKCEVYSRVTGFMRPVSNWNDAKQEEWKNTKLFNVTSASERSSYNGYYVGLQNRTLWFDSITSC